MSKLFLIYWGLAGLLTLDITLRVQSSDSDTAHVEAELSASDLADALRARCELPAGTVVFVIREEARP